MVNVNVNQNQNYKYEQYEVKEGDTWESIAQNFGVSVDELVAFQLSQGRSTPDTDYLPEPDLLLYIPIKIPYLDQIDPSLAEQIRAYDPETKLYQFYDPLSGNISWLFLDQLLGEKKQAIDTAFWESRIQALIPMAHHLNVLSLAVRYHGNERPWFTDWITTLTQEYGEGSTEELFKAYALQHILIPLRAANNPEAITPSFPNFDWRSSWQTFILPDFLSLSAQGHTEENSIDLRDLSEDEIIDLILQNARQLDQWPQSLSHQPLLDLTDTFLQDYFGTAKSDAQQPFWRGEALGFIQSQQLNQAVDAQQLHELSERIAQMRDIGMVHFGVNLGPIIHWFDLYRAYLQRKYDDFQNLAGLQDTLYGLDHPEAVRKAYLIRLMENAFTSSEILGRFGKTLAQMTLKELEEIAFAQWARVQYGEGSESDEQLRLAFSNNIDFELFHQEVDFGAFLLFAANFIPFVEDLLDVLDFIQALSDGDLAGILLAGVGLIPLLGDSLQLMGRAERIAADTLDDITDARRGGGAIANLDEAEETVQNVSKKVNEVEQSLKDTIDKIATTHMNRGRNGIVSIEEYLEQLQKLENTGQIKLGHPAFMGQIIDIKTDWNLSRGYNESIMSIIKNGLLEKYGISENFTIEQFEEFMLSNHWAIKFDEKYYSIELSAVFGSDGSVLGVWIGDTALGRYGGFMAFPPGAMLDELGEINPGATFTHLHNIGGEYQISEPDLKSSVRLAANNITVFRAVSFDYNFELTWSNESLEILRTSANNRDFLVRVQDQIAIIGVEQQQRYLLTGSGAPLPAFRMGESSGVIPLLIKVPITSDQKQKLIDAGFANLISDEGDSTIIQLNAQIQITPRRG